MVVELGSLDQCVSSVDAGRGGGMKGLSYLTRLFSVVGGFEVLWIAGCLFLFLLYFTFIYLLVHFCGSSD